MQLQSCQDFFKLVKNVIKFFFDLLKNNHLFEFARQLKPVEKSGLFHPMSYEIVPTRPRFPTKIMRLEQHLAGGTSRITFLIQRRFKIRHDRAAMPWSSLGYDFFDSS